jgi:hypothetical protein
MFKTKSQEDKEKLLEAGIGIVGLTYGNIIPKARSAERYEIILEFNCSEAEADKILGKEVKSGKCQATTKAGGSCKGKAVADSDYCMAHQKEK